MTNRTKANGIVAKERSCFYIFNPHAGRIGGNQAHSRLQEVINLLPGSGYAISRNYEHLTDLARRAARSHDTVVACGGDGTVRQVVEGILGTGVQLGIVPMGSGNDLAGTMGIPGDAFEALRLISHGPVRAMDLGRINGHCFVNTCGVGFDGLTNYYASRVSGRPGMTMYLGAALKACLKFRAPEVRLQLDDRIIEGRKFMVTFANGRREGGGFHIAPEALLDDGQLHVLIVENIKSWRVPLLLPRFLNGTHMSIRETALYRTVEARLSTEPSVAVHTDGEVFDTRLSDMRIELLPGAIPVIAPSGSEAFQNLGRHRA